MTGPASACVRAAPAVAARPWPRHLLPAEDWRRMVDALPSEPDLALVGLWADAAQVHALFLEAGARPLAASVAVERGRYLALSAHRPGAALFERAVADLWGHEGVEARDLRPWLDHGHWPYHRPLSPRPVPAGTPPEPPEMLPPGEGEAQLPIGPIRPRFAEPAHLRATLREGRVARLEARLGYAHRGLLAALRGKPPRAAAPLVARLAADATVAHALAFAQAAEAALEVTPPPRAVALRRAMLECERIAGHLDALATLCAAAGDPVAPPRLAWQIEAMRRAAATAFGHRLMRDRVVPGGVAGDLANGITPDGPAVLRAALAGLAAELPALARLLGRPGLTDRLSGLGATPPAVVAVLAPDGVAGRAAGRGFDARALSGGPPSPVLGAGDAAARLRLRVAEIERALRELPPLLDDLPEGALSASLPMVGGEGFGVVEGARGDVWHWLRLEAGQIAAAFPCDPAWLHWPLFEAAAAGCDREDLTLIEASFGCGVAGMDG